MKWDSLVAFFKHVAEREASHGVPHAFRFNSVLSSRKNGNMLPARYKDDDNPDLVEAEPIPVLSRRNRRKLKKPIPGEQALLNSSEVIETIVVSAPNDDSSPAEKIIQGPSAPLPGLRLPRRAMLPTPEGTPSEPPTSDPRRSLRNKGKLSAPTNNGKSSAPRNKVKVSAPTSSTPKRKKSCRKKKRG